MRISKIKFKNSNAKYSILIGLGAVRSLKKEIGLVCPDAKKIALIFDKKIPGSLKSKVRKQIKNYSLLLFHERKCVQSLILLYRLFLSRPLQQKKF